MASITATAQENKIAVNAGFLFPSTLNATVGYERSFTYGNAVEVYGEIGNHWKSGEGQFWKGYYWDGGIIYKHRLHRYKNGSFRVRFGPQFGAVERKFSSVSREALNTTMCFRTDASSRSYRRIM